MLNYCVISQKVHEDTTDIFILALTLQTLVIHRQTGRTKQFHEACQVYFWYTSGRQKLKTSGIAWRIVCFGSTGKGLHSPGLSNQQVSLAIISYAEVYIN